MISAAELKRFDLLECGGIRYRILGIAEKIVAIQTDITKRVFRLFEPGPQFDAEILSGRMRIIPCEIPRVIPKMSSVCQAAFDLNKQIINEIAGIYGKDHYIGLSSREFKEPLTRIEQKYLISRTRLNRLITRWLQSGCSDYSLLDHRAEGLRTANGPYHYTKRPGRKNQKEEDTSTALLDDNLRKVFDEVIKRKMGAKLGFFSTYFRDVVNERYSDSLKLNEKYLILREEARNTPTLRQFYHYLSNHSGVTDKDRYVAEHSESEYRNNCRALNSDTNYGVHGIGDRMETDILDMDVILRAQGFDIPVGRPHLYLIIDISTRVIPGFFISYTNNSVTGLQGLMHNLGEDKVELCRKYGIEISPDEWPSMFLPGCVFVDNGADFSSNQIMEIFTRLGIERNLEPPAQGSMKGTIEHLFCQFCETHKDLLEKHGVILKRHDSKHYEEAVLDMDDIIRIVILFIISHNKQYMPEYPITKEMLDENMECSPVNLFCYMKERYPVRIITDPNQYQLDCMFEERASVKRGDIVFHKHHYSPDPNDQAFRKDFAESTKTQQITVRYTRISSDFIRYEHNGLWYTAQLNTQRTDEASFAGLTRDELETYDNQKLSNDAVGARKNTKILGDCRKNMKDIVKKAEKKALQARNVSPEEKDHILRCEKKKVLGNVLSIFKKPAKEEQSESKKETVTQITEMSWDEAMEDLYI